MNLSIFILAAGRGERLRPITDHIPKPLLPILGKPVLQNVLERVSALSATKIGINLHHKKKFIENWLNRSAFSRKVELFPEDPILGTGGALKNAEIFLKNVFLVHNSDIVTDIDLSKLVEFHLSSENLVTLAVHDYPEFNKLVIDELGLLKEIVKTPPCHPAGYRYLAFTGIAVYSPEFLKFLPEGVSSVVDAWLKASAAGHRIGTFDVSGCYWTDIGTPMSYARTVIDELRKNGEMVWIHPSVTGCENIEMDGCVVIENKSNPPSPPFSKGGVMGFSYESIFNQGISLRNCIMLPGSHTKSNSQYENCILGPGFKIDLSESEMLGLTKETDAILIGTGGSDRKYFRVKRGNHSTVLMQCPDGDPDFQRHIQYTRFFKKYSVPVPQMLDVNPDKKSALFEDLGDLSLYGWLKCPRDEGQIEEIYKKVIDILVTIHTVATEHASECVYLKDRFFDYEYLRWETGYFIERFVESIRNIRGRDFSALNNEFHRLAVKMDSFSRTVIHRDFQSQNIMITKGSPRLVDYQGARIGPPAYDIASILWDPYYRLQDDLRERLLNYYIKLITNPPQSSLNKGGRAGITESEFRGTILSCKLQRHMQALGAYGFLSSVKGKKYFLKYVPEGLRLLREDVLLSKDEYPGLYDLTAKL